MPDNGGNRLQGPKSHLRWPAALFGVFGVLAGLCVVILSLMSLFDYVTEPNEVANPTAKPNGPALEDVVSRPSPPGQFFREGSAPTPPTTSLLPSTSSTDDPTSPRQQAIAHAKSKRRTFLAQIREAMKILDQCDSEIAKWNTTVRPLLENEAGRKIASDSDLVRQIRIALRQDRPSAEYVIELRAALRDLAEPFEHIAEDSNSSVFPIPETMNELSRLQSEIRSTRDTLQGSRERVLAVASQAQGLSAIDTSLSQAIDAINQAELIASTKLLDSESTRAEQEAAEARAKLAAEQIRREAAERLESEKAEAERQRLIKRAQMPDVQRYLAPFLAKGYLQPKSERGVGMFVKTTRLEPMSFSKISRTGALEPTISGLNVLNQLGSDTGTNELANDRRPLWGFGYFTNRWSRSDQEYLQKAQELLRELGPTLVELEMLAP